MATLTQLEEARTAYHRLVVDGGVQAIREGDRWLQYTPASVRDLEAYINRLERELGMAVTSFTKRVQSRPVLF
jgi:hypothetical protein